MLGHVLLVETPPVVDPVELMAALGWSRPVASEDAIEGADVGACARRLQDARPQGPLTMFAVTATERWTIVSDLNDALTEAGAEMAALADALEARVIALRIWPRECGLTWYEKGRLRRRIDQVGHERTVEGDRLAVEALFTDPNDLDETDLITVMQALGLDVERLNRSASYQVLAY